MSPEKTRSGVELRVDTVALVNRDHRRRERWMTHGKQALPPRSTASRLLADESGAAAIQSCFSSGNRDPDKRETESPALLLGTFVRATRNIIIGIGSFSVRCVS
ncbi:hypothetical protein MRX96_047767 [Rhipicephalus microplus]